MTASVQPSETRNVLETSWEERFRRLKPHLKKTRIDGNHDPYGTFYPKEHQLTFFPDIPTKSHRRQSSSSHGTALRSSPSSAATAGSGRSSSRSSASASSSSQRGDGRRYSTSSSSRRSRSRDASSSSSTSPSPSPSAAKKKSSRGGTPITSGGSADSPKRSPNLKKDYEPAPLTPPVLALLKVMVQPVTPLMSPPPSLDNLESFKAFGVEELNNTNRRKRAHKETSKEQDTLTSSKRQKVDSRLRRSSGSSSSESSSDSGISSSSDSSEDEIQITKSKRQEDSTKKTAESETTSSIGRATQKRKDKRKDKEGRGKEKEKETVKSVSPSPGRTRSKGNEPSEQDKPRSKSRRESRMAEKDRSNGKISSESERDRNTGKRQKKSDDRERRLYNSKERSPDTKRQSSSGGEASNVNNPTKATASPSATARASNKDDGSRKTALRSAALQQEAIQLKRIADSQMKNDEKKEALDLYLESGLKFLEHCHELEREAGGNQAGIKSAAIVYKQTAKFFERCGRISAEQKDRCRAYLCYKCMGVAFARVIALKREHLRRMRDDLYKTLREASPTPTSPSPSPNSAGVTSGSNHFTPSPISTKDTSSIPSPSPSPSDAGLSSGGRGREGGAPAAPSSFVLSSSDRNKQLAFLEDVDDMLRLFDAWGKAEAYNQAIHANKALKDLEPFPHPLEQLVTSSQSLANSVTQHVRKVLELLNS
ncbi:HECT domain-containing protein [Balamuthia mandrillaris]